MESNNLILGRIPTNGGGICKTYPESIIRYIDNDNSHMIKFPLHNNAVMREKLYIDKNSNEIVIESSLNEEDKNASDYREAEILSVYPLMFTSQYGTHYEYFIEVIEKEVLLNHLRDERMLMEDIRNGALSLTLK
ncbi:MAG: hypothetical protein IKR57_05220 [Bacilli bacterium]|nr:hypothetical protein [Bacilli bacterium]